MTGDAGRSDIPICIGRRPSNATSFGQRPSVFACHDITPRMTLGFRPLVLFFTFSGAGAVDLKLQPNPLNLISNSIPNTSAFEVAELDTRDKPKPFSSADERDVEPCL